MTGRCLIVADGFYEFTPHTDPKSNRKHKWLFTKADEPWFCIAGIWRSTEIGEAFTMLTTYPGPDVARWLDTGSFGKEHPEAAARGKLER
jgi:putative SOS response-associated peptidase YedK